jgi:hypothetical protein
MRNKKEVSYSLQLMIQLQKLSYRERQSGYALLMASVMSILIFSMLTVYIFSSRVSKSTANAMVDAGSTFYAAETGLNARAHEMRSKVGNFSRPTGISPTDNSPVGSPLGTRVASMMASCLSPNAAQKGSGDFACTESNSKYAESTMSGADGNVSMERRTNAAIKYKTYSFVQDITPAVVALTVIPANNDFAGLRSTDYQYRVYSTSLKQADNSPNVSAQAMLQMQFTDRFIPIFQFAAFYNGNMEITSSPPMSINGPVHSNASIYLAPGNLLTFTGNVTYVNSINRSLLSRAVHLNNGSRISFNGGSGYTDAPATCNGITAGCVSGEEAWTSSTYPIAISAADLAKTNGSVTKTNTLRLPPSGFLSKQIGTTPAGVYWNKADLRVDFDPLNTTNPFSITRMNQNVDPPTPIENFSADLINSLRKPVMLRLRPTILGGVVNANETTRRFSEVIRLCPKLAGTPGEPANIAAALPTTVPAALSALTQADQNAVVAALQLAIVQTSVDDSLTFSRMQAPAIGELRTNFTNALTTALASASSTTRANIVNTNLNDIAALSTTGTGSTSTGGGANGSSGGCFLPPPMQVTNQYDKREGRMRNGNMWILQSNIKSLTAWNRDGVYGTGLLPASNKLFTRKDASTLAAEDQLPDNNNTVNVTGANCDYDCLGLGSVDGARNSGITTTSQGGLVWHYSLINRLAPYNYASNPSNPQAHPPVVVNRNDTLGVSQYGFAFSGGARLPGSLTVVSDQAMYIQGDYNNPRSTPGVISATDPLDNNSTATTANRVSGAGGTNPAEREKRPASILGDSAIVLSNNCSDNNFKINCLLNLPNSQMNTASNTVVRAAILAGTEATVSAAETSGGLNNFLSFRESWLNFTIKYRGSMVSKGIPTEFNGQFIAGCGGACTTVYTYFYPPTRDFGFDTDFNSVQGLPPLTPNVNLLIQRVYKRDYDATNRS